jgi:DNA-binding LacI/PurR family transcriptional regulator
MIVGSLNKEGRAEPRIIELARGGFVDGILAVTNDPLRHSGGPSILSAQLPSVALLVDLSPFGVPSVVVTEREGMRMLTEHLIARGRRRLMYVGGTPGYHDVERVAGFHDAVRASLETITTVHISGDYLIPSGVEAARTFLSMPERPDGVVLTSDWMALAFMDHLREAGVRVPEDVSVTGFDDIEASRFVQPATHHVFATPRTDGWRGGRHAARPDRRKTDRTGRTAGIQRRAENPFKQLI